MRGSCVLGGGFRPVVKLEGHKVKDYSFVMQMGIQDHTAAKIDRFEDIGLTGSVSPKDPYAFEYFLPITVNNIRRKSLGRRRIDFGRPEIEKNLIFNRKKIL
jgi:hypothetical protein